MENHIWKMDVDDMEDEDEFVDDERETGNGLEDGDGSNA